MRIPARQPFDNTHDKDANWRSFLEKRNNALRSSFDRTATLLRLYEKPCYTPWHEKIEGVSRETEEALCNPNAPRKEVIRGNNRWGWKSVYSD